MKICGEVLLAVDAFDAMACDQGGSSMMYSKINGIINRPADGNERIVYSHLGFRLKKIDL
jgi:exopolysaccharide biosynthesis protein